MTVHFEELLVLKGGVRLWRIFGPDTELVGYVGMGDDGHYRARAGTEQSGVALPGRFRGKRAAVQSLCRFAKSNNNWFVKQEALFGKARGLAEQLPSESAA